MWKKIPQPKQEINLVPWIPVATAHAIERTRIAVAFAPELSSKTVEAAGKAADPAAAELGLFPRAALNAENFAVGIGPDGPKLTGRKMVAWQITNAAEPGAGTEALQVDQSGIQYETSNYVRWALFMDHFLKLAGKSLDALDAVSDAQVVSLEYFDRFIFEGEMEDGRPGDLLDATLVQILGDPAKSGKELWHLHRGWFGEQDGERFLVNQNLDAVDGQTLDNKPIRTVQIMTKIERRGADGSISLTNIAPLLEKMHTLSKATLVGVLSAEAQSKIGL
jgi:uncharacterized protein (TIGR04255 family)